MSTTHAVFSASPERIFTVLCDPEAYADWVVGAHSIRDADANWPAVGSRFYHRVGAPPFTVADHTEVLEVSAPYRLVLRARARPIGTAIVRMELQAEGNGETKVSMTEVAGDPLSRMVLNPLTYPLVHRRNVEALRRLKRIAETGVQDT